MQEEFDTDRNLLAKAESIIKRGIRTREDLDDALRFQRLLKKVLGRKFEVQSNLTEALSLVSARSAEAAGKQSDLLDRPLIATRPNIRVGELVLDGKALRLVETTRNGKSILLWQEGERPRGQNLGAP